MASGTVDRLQARGEFGSHFTSALRLYWEISRRGYRRYATYRGSTLAGVFTNTVFGFLRAYVLIALFTARPHVGGYSIVDALTYAWLTQATLMTIYLWNWYEIAERIRSGNITADLGLPVDFQTYWLSQDLGRALYHAVFRGIPPFVLGGLAFHIFLPHNPLTYAFFVLSLTVAVCLSFAMRYIINILAFWLLDYRGIGTLAAMFWTFLSGFAIPLSFFPAPWRGIVEVLPFAGLVQIPVNIYLEKQQGFSLGGQLTLQLFWTLTLLVLGRWLMSAALRKIVIQGG